MYSTQVFVVFAIYFSNVFVLSRHYAHTRNRKWVIYDTTHRTKDTIRLNSVIVNKDMLNAKQRYEQKKEDYRLIYFWGDTKGMLGFSNGLSLNLNKLYNKFSKKGRDSRRLQRVFEKEYIQDLVLEKWLPLTKEYTNLENDSLAVFRSYYQPQISWINDCDDYERIAYIVNCLKNYKDSATYIHFIMAIPDSLK